MKKIIDTNVILQYPEIILSEDCVIPSIVISELEHIKTSGTKSDEVKFQARQAVRILSENEDKYSIFVASNDTYQLVEKYNLPINNDNLIIACCKQIESVEDVVFCSNDMLARLIASDIFELNVESYSGSKDEVDEYKGYKEVELDERSLAKFYESLKVNQFDCLENEYVILKNEDGEAVDTRRWTSKDGYVEVFNKTVRSNNMKIKLKAKDEQQLMAIDSLYNNTMTVISGKAGSGKSLLSLAVAMNLIESDKYRRLVVLFNPTKAKGASEQGFYKGTATDKAMQNSIGEVLCSKFNNRSTVDMLINQDKLKLVCISDCRGMQVNDDEILYITESQNTSIELMKLCLSRASQGAKIIIEGDYNSQVDSYAFENKNNGMKRAIEVLKGNDIFGYVELKNVHRSKIAALVELM